MLERLGYLIYIFIYIAAILVANILAYLLVIYFGFQIFSYVLLGGLGGLR